jgi:hypothetical protein
MEQAFFVPVRAAAGDLQRAAVVERAGDRPSRGEHADDPTTVCNGQRELVPHERRVAVAAADEGAGLLEPTIPAVILEPPAVRVSP